MTQASGSGSGGSGKLGRELSQTDSSMMWIDKYSPQSVEELVINKKKVREFIDIIEEGSGGGFLVLHGAPGSCKNTLIRTYCQQYGARLVEHTETKIHHAEHVFGQKETV